MTFFVDVEFIDLVSINLDQFKRKSNNVFNFRCPYCGDSHKDKTKARGYLYAVKDSFYYKCHNCQKSTNFQSFLKDIDPGLYGQYKLKKFSKKNHTHSKPLKYKKTKLIKNDVLSNLERCDRLSEDHICVQYLLNRKIPRKKWNLLYFIDDFIKFEDYLPKYKNKLKGSGEQRLVIPFFNLKNVPYAYVCRALDKDNSKRYIALSELSTPLFYGFERVDKTKKIYILEGPLDSLFIDNAISVGGLSLDSLKFKLKKYNTVYIVDNQPKHEDVLKMMEKLINDGQNVCIWPKWLKGKDLNDMIMNGEFEPFDSQKIVDQNTYNGAKAKEMFRMWKWR